MTERIRDMLFERRHRHLPGQAPRRAYCRLEGWRLIVGVQSAHRTNAARKLRTQLRLIRARAAAEIGRGIGGSNVEFSGGAPLHGAASAGTQG